MIIIQNKNTQQIITFSTEEEFALRSEFFQSADWERWSDEAASDYVLEKEKEKKEIEVKTKRDIFQNIPITIGNNTYKSTRDAKLLFWSKVNGAVAADYPIKWRLVNDKTPSYLTKDQANTLYEAFEEQEASGFDQESNFLTRIDEAKTLEELNAINIEYK